MMKDKGIETDALPDGVMSESTDEELMLNTDDPLATVPSIQVPPIEHNKDPSVIEFILEEGKPWLMRLEGNSGSPLIKFNTEEYPDCLPDDFAKAVVGILCRVGYISEYKEEEATK